MNMRKLVAFVLLSAILLPFMNSIIMVRAGGQEGFNKQNEETVQMNKTTEENIIIQNTGAVQIEEQVATAIEVSYAGPVAATADTTEVDITNISALGNITHYNGIVFDQFIASQADIEGAFAAGGKAYIATKAGQGFDFGGAIKTIGYIGNYSNPNGYPTLLLNDAPVLGKTLDGGKGGNRVGIIGGPAVLNISSKAEYEENTLKFALEGTSLLYAADATVNQFFANVKNTVTKTVDVLNNASTTGITISNFNASSTSFKNWSEEELKAYEATGLKNTGNMRILVMNITDAGQVSVRGPSITSAFTRYDLIIFNFPNATTVNFDYESLYVDGTQLFPGGGGTVHSTYVPAFASKIIWNMPKATTVNVKSCSVIGSVLAPYAAVKGDGGSINGMLIANSYETVNSCELHAFTLNKIIFDFEKDNGEEEKEGALVVTKVDEENTPLDGVTFVLYYVEDGVTYYYSDNSWTTNRDKATVLITKNGSFKISGLPYKTYYIEETQTLEAYELLDEKIEITIEKDETTKKIINKKKIVEEPTGILAVEKVDKDTKEQILDEATFLLYRIQNGEKVYYQKTADEILWTTEENATVLSTGNEGFFRITGLLYDTYYLKEVSAPVGYILAEEETTVIISGLEEAATVIENKKEETPEEILGGLQIIKYDTENEENYLPGAEFILYYLEGETAQYYKVDNGKVVFTEEKETATIIKTNEGGTGTVTSLPLGTYYLVETKAPEGYKLTTEIAEVTLESSVLQVLKVGNEKETEPEEPEKKGSLTVKKVDKDHKEQGLEGAEFILYRLEGEEKVYYARQDESIFWTKQQELAYILVTNEQGSILVEDLPLGNYVLQEQKAPVGYILGEEETTVTISGLEEAATVIENKKEETPEEILGGLQIIKYDTENEENYLPGAEFILYYLEGETAQYYKIDNGKVVFTEEKETATIIKTNEGGTGAVTGLPLGTYYLVETKAPEGYVVMEETVEITINSQEPVAYRIANEKEELPNPEMKGLIQVIKVDEEFRDRTLAGAIFVLYYKQGNTKHYLTAQNETDCFWTEEKEDALLFVTDKDGMLEIENIPVGKYYLEEIKAPEGYQVLNSAVSIAVEAVTTEVMVITNKPLEEIPEEPKEPEEPDNPKTPEEPEKEKPTPSKPGKKPKPEKPSTEKPTEPETPSGENDGNKNPKPGENTSEKPVITEPITVLPDDENRNNDYNSNESNKNDNGNIITIKENPKTGDTVNHDFKFYFYCMIMVGVVSFTVFYYLRKD